MSGTEQDWNRGQESFAATDKATICLLVCRVACIKLMLRFKLNAKAMHSFTVISIFILVLRDENI
jgi:hypothetical protein